MNAKPISDADIADTLSNLATAPLGIGDDKEFRISIAGAQDKTAFLHWKEKWHIPHGTTATTHILKPQIGQRDTYDLTHSVENEQDCCQALSVPPTRKYQTEGGPGIADILSLAMLTHQIVCFLRDRTWRLCQDLLDRQRSSSDSDSVP